MKVRVVYKPDGTVAVIHPAPKSRRKDETEAAWLARVFTKGMQGDLAGLPFDDMDSSELPQERTYREAWRGSKGAGVHVDAAVKAEIDARVPPPTTEELAARITALEAALAAKA